MSESQPSLEAVIYCDGGCRAAAPHQAASRGYGGWGIHGYFFTREAPKVGAGAKKGVPSPHGYDLKGSGKGTITVLDYVDGFGTIDGEATNNIAELEAAIRALTLAKDRQVKRVLLRTDSKYVVDGMSKWMANWSRHDWKKPSGEPVPNNDRWKIIEALTQAIKDAGGKAEAEWVKGHSGEPGNEIVDRYATRGVLAGKHRRVLDICETTDAKGYWKRDYAAPRLLNLANWYFSTSKDMDRVTEDGKSIYYLGDIRDYEEFYGKPISNATFAVVYLNEPCQLLEKLRDQFIELARGTLKGLVVSPIRQIFSPALADVINRYGEQLMVLHPQRQLIEHMDRAKEGDDEGMILGHEIRPTRLAFHAVGLLESLEVILQLVLHPTPQSRLVLTDITPVLYEQQASGKKTVTKLASHVTVSTPSVTIPIAYRDGEQTGTKPVCFTLGQDLPDRNTLAALACEAIKVTAVTWLESPVAFRFATVIETPEGVGLWAGPYANLQLIPAAT